MFFEGFQEFRVNVGDGIEIAGVKGGSGPALLLLHGFPQSRHIWHKVAPELSKSYTIIAPDLRGYGESSKPTSGYVKSLMAKDMSTLMSKMNFSSYFICAHDRGARVAHKLLVDNPEPVKKAIFLDIAPTLKMFESTDQEFATAYFHWFFLIQPAPFPEKTITQNAKQFAEFFMGARWGGLKHFHPDALAYYVKVMGQEDAAHAMCEDYRAAADGDLEEARNDIKAGKLIQTPLRVLWGKHGIIEKCFDAVKNWQEVSNSTVDGNAVESGHYIPEENPDIVIKNIKEFLV